MAECFLQKKRPSLFPQTFESLIETSVWLKVINSGLAQALCSVLDCISVTCWVTWTIEERTLSSLHTVKGRLSTRSDT